MEIFFLIGLLILYFLPAFVASKRDHQSTGMIILLNIFTGWTGVGWLVVMIWAFRD